MDSNPNSVWNALRRRWPIVVLFTVLGGVIGALPSPKRVEDQAQQYTATNTMVVNQPQLGFDSNLAINPNQLTLFATNGDVPEAVWEQLGYGENPASLAAQVEVVYDQSNGSLTFTTTQDDADRAVAIADAFATELQAFVASEQDAISDSRTGAIEERITLLENDLEELEGEVAFRPDDLVLQAQVAAKQSQLQTQIELRDQLQQTETRLVLNNLSSAQAVAIEERGLGAPTSRTTRALLGAGVGFVVGLAIALLLARLDRKIRTPEQLEAATGLKVRAVIPHEPRNEHGDLVVLPDRHDALADAYRAMRALLSFLAADLPDRAGGRMVLVVSPGPSDGKTSVASNLAAAFAESGGRTIAVNTDFRRPALIPRLLGGRRLQWDIPLEEAARRPVRSLVVPSPKEGLGVMDLASIQASPNELARTTAGHVPELRKVADTIVVDTSPVTATAEVLEMVPQADLVVIVTRLGHTPTESARRTVESVKALSRAELVLTMVGANAKSGYYDYYSAYYAPAAAQAGAAPEKRRRFRRSKG